ncbi:MAG: ribonuclease Y [Elusimicrobiota bacterium]|jgi:ribonuclease Y|nr:ribonuclease Y [Elusimicrobiota bacterium]
MQVILFSLLSLVFGAVIGFIIRYFYAKHSLASFENNAKIAEDKAKNLLKEAIKEAEAKKKELLIEAKDHIYKDKQEFEKELKERRVELQQYEKSLTIRENDIARKQENSLAKEHELKNRERDINNRSKEIDEIRETMNFERSLLRKELEKISRMTSEEAKQILIQQIENEAKKDASIRLQKIEDELKKDSDKKAKEIISLAIQRVAVEHTSDITVTTVTIPNEDMKGRIIGREGRNIRVFEATTGVDVIVDDTPEAITLTSFDGVRREIARVSLERLIVDGRIHPARIEEMVAKVTKEMEVYIKEVGEQAALQVGISGLPDELIRLIGRLKYRTSYGQNILKHSLEVAYLSKLMAAELKLDIDLCLKAGFFHDIGKSVDHDVEGTHAQIGADILKKYYPNNHKLINAVLAHHEGEAVPETLEAVIVATADAISAARPGARREKLEFYLKRVQKLEEVANSFKGVERSFAIQAGREIRIIVEPTKIKEEETILLAKDIAQKIEKEVDYPGQIKVTLIRETRHTDIAK